MSETEIASAAAYSSDTDMRLRRLVEMIQEDSAGAADWPVMFAAYRQSPSGEWEEQDIGGREGVTGVDVDNLAQEVLLIRDSTCPPLTVSNFEERLLGLMVSHGDFTVDTCEPPIVVDEDDSIRIDLPIEGVGRDDGRSCYLVVFASSARQ
jgi:hypothetical protein